MEIVGVGFSGPETTADWVEEESFPYEVWTDSDERTLAITYGAADNASAFSPDRVTMLLGAEGNLRLEYRDNIQVGTHPAQVLEDCQAIFGE